MLIGTMNHPGRNIFREIEWMAEMGLEFLDLTLEPPETASWKIALDLVRAALEKHRMKVVGHTAYYLPLASTIPEIREAAVQELARCIRVFKEIGAAWMNIHPDRYTPMHDRARATIVLPRHRSRRTRLKRPAGEPRHFAPSAKEARKGCAG